MTTGANAFNAYDEYVHFFTSRPSLEEIVGFKPSNLTTKRVTYLVEAYNAGKISSKEFKELIEYAKAEDFMNNLRVRAERRLRQQMRNFPHNPNRA
jgi:hypothetical protein